jgi:hypothetical protein
MVLLPIALVLLVFGLAVYRLVQIPRKLWSGDLRLAGGRFSALWVATVAAYVLLLGSTVALIVTLLRTLLWSGGDVAEYLSLLGYLAAYPLVYLAAAWVFFYGLKSGDRAPANG